MTNRKILKKLFFKNQKRLLEIQEIIDKTNLDYVSADWIAKKLNLNDKKLMGGKIYFALENPNFFDADGIDEILLRNGIINKNAKKLIKSEFSYYRLESSYNHFLDYSYEDLGAGVNGFDIVFFTNGNKVGWEYKDYSYNTAIEMDINLIDSLQQNSGQYSYEIFDCYSFKETRYFFKNGATLGEAVKLQFKILLEFMRDLNSFKKEFIEKVEMMRSAVSDLNSLLENGHEMQVEEDILDFVQENKLIIDGDIDKIEFDFIAEVEGDKVKTNKGAIVNLSDAKRVLNEILTGLDVVGKKIGLYTINKAYFIKNTLFIRIGCHLIKIDDNLKNQLK